MTTWRVLSYFSKRINEVEPLEDPEIKDIIKEVSERMNFKIHGVYVITPKKPILNAVHVKLAGKFNYIYIIGPLKKFFSIEEITVIMAHEIAHAKKKHVMKLIITKKLATILALTLSSAFIITYGTLIAPHLQVSSPSPLQLVLVLLITSLMILFIPMLIVCYFSRKMELEADIEAAKLYGTDLCIKTLKKLESLYNKKTKQPRLLTLMSTHSPIEKRIKNLEKISKLVKSKYKDMT